jgi:hypothetical protein
VLPDVQAPGPHPEPPAGFGDRQLPLRHFEGDFYRTYNLDREPIYFGRSCSKRFDDPQREFGVLYAALDQYGSFIETFGQVQTRTVTTSELKNRGLIRLSTRSPLTVIDLTLSGALARAGADSRIFAGGYDVSQRWSRAFYAYERCRVQGLMYPARHDPTRFSLAIFEGAEGIRELDRRPWYDDGADEKNSLRPLLGLILEHYRFSLVETVARPQRKGPGRAPQQARFPFDDPK